MTAPNSDTVHTAPDDTTLFPMLRSAVSSHVRMVAGDLLRGASIA